MAVGNLSDLARMLFGRSLPYLLNHRRELLLGLLAGFAYSGTKRYHLRSLTCFVLVGDLGSENTGVGGRFFFWGLAIRFGGLAIRLLVPRRVPHLLLGLVFRWKN